MEKRELIKTDTLLKDAGNQIFQCILIEAVNNARDNKPLDFTEEELLRNIDRASLNDKKVLNEFKSLANEYIKEYSLLSDHGLVKKHIDQVISIIDDVIAAKE